MQHNLGIIFLSMQQINPLLVFCSEKVFSVMRFQDSAPVRAKFAFHLFIYLFIIFKPFSGLLKYAILQLCVIDSISRTGRTKYSWIQSYYKIKVHSIS